jgi:GT2 family glycosyltransferase
LAVDNADGALICLLNDDIVVLHPGWLNEMAGLAARPDVGMVGALLLFEDGTVQHAGVTLGLQGHVAGHTFHYARESMLRRRPLSGLTRRGSAVTAACAVMRREVYHAVGGMDAEYLAVNYNDLDLSLKVRGQGYNVVWTPYARLIHAESLSRGKEHRTDRNARSNAESGLIATRWKAEIHHDRFWNPNFSLETTVPELSFLPSENSGRGDVFEWTREHLLRASEPVANRAPILPHLPAFHAAKFATHLGRSDLAADLAREALVQEPDAYTANLAAGTCLAMTGRSVAAARLYQYACLISPVAIRPWVYRGQIAANLGQNEDAHRFLTIALAKDPFNEQALATLNRLPGSTRLEAEPARLIPLNSDPRLTQQAYTDWIARYDVLGDEDRVKIRARVESLTPTGKAEVLPLFSLIMPARDPDPDYFRAAVRSVVDQLYPHWELCVADDGSRTEVVASIVAEFAALGHPVRLVRSQNSSGIAAASNAALALATGEFIALIDHDDVLAEHALYMFAESITRNDQVDLLYSDEDKLDERGRRFSPHFKPSFNKDLLRSQNYIGHLLAVRRAIVKQIGGFTLDVDGAQDHDLILRVLEAVGPARIRHIPFILYHWRSSPTSVAQAVDAKSYTTRVGVHVVADHLKRLGEAATVSEGMASNTYGILYATPDPPPLVSIIVPTRDQVALLSKCIDGLTQRTRYEAWELLIVDNGSRAPETQAYLEKVGCDPRIKVLRDDGAFNYARLNNRAVAETSGPLLLFLNDDVEPINEGWLDEMVRHVARAGVAGVGAKLVYPNETLQHAGVIIGAGGVAGHFEKHLPAKAAGYHRRAQLVQNFQAVTGACMLLRRSVFEAVGGFDAEHLKVNFNDVDLCLRIRHAGHALVWTPYARLRHHESATRGKDFTPEQAAEHAREAKLMQARWRTNNFADPAFNPNLSLDVETPVLAYPPRVRKPWL